MTPAQYHTGGNGSIRVPLPAIPAPDSATARLPAEISRPLERHWNVVLDVSGWPERAVALDMLFHHAIGSMERGPMWAFQLSATSGMATALLEQLGEREITCLVQAVVYRASVHLSWRTAANRWLERALAGADLRAWAFAHPNLALLMLRVMSAEIETGAAS